MQNSPKRHKTANRRQGLREQFLIIRSLPRHRALLWVTKVLYDRSQKPAESQFACPYEKPSWILCFVFHHCNYQSARAADIANWLLTSKAARHWSHRANGGALGGSSCWQRASEQLTTLSGGMMDLPTTSMCRGTWRSAKLPAAFKISRSLWLLLSYPCLQVSRTLARTLCFRAQAEGLRVLLTWCL